LQGARLKYRFINEHQLYGDDDVCRVLNVARAGFYAWLVSARDKDNQRLLMLIRDSYS
jgi:hypothetical protein